MKSFIILSILLIGINQEVECITKTACFQKVDEKMNDLLNNQIKLELQAHYTYLKLSYLFNDYKSYYPKVSQFFRAKSDEEMEHAERFIQYQNQRGGNYVPSSVTVYKQNKCAGSIDNITKAFQCAKQVEIFITKSLTQLMNNAMKVPTTGTTTRTLNSLSKSQPILITVSGGSKVTINEYLTDEETDCSESFEYVELAEMISHEFLGHQMIDTKELANYVKTLENLDKSENDSLGHYLFDKNF